MSNGFRLIIHMPIIFPPTHGYLTISFPDTDMAASYFRIVNHASSLFDDANLDPKLQGQDVSFRLPSRISEIEALNSGHGGWWFTFTDENLAKQWKEHLVLWTYMGFEFDPCKLFISGLLWTPEGGLREKLAFLDPQVPAVWAPSDNLNFNFPDSMKRIPEPGELSNVSNFHPRKH
ncbi:hypothetical protein B0T19DRAFT_399946 [Cercophora scortea]|uniref:Uncharacterized protein n=1 Tax=Cercophora scortea TaxID=314031 RepID=A0AAE0ILC5_9PEZI|nr:hypothetical protein B0T19DRAFT_399946 [Cercophora scortea]